MFLNFEKVAACLEFLYHSWNLSESVPRTNG